MLMYDHANKIKIFASLIIFAFLFSFLGFNNVSALEDVSETYNDGASHVICASGPGWNGFMSCEGYNYITITSDGVGSSAELAWNASVNFGPIRIGNANTIIINKPLVSGDYLRFSLSNYSSGSYTVTLSEKLPGYSGPTGSLTITENGTFDVSEVASVNVNVPQEEVTEIIDDPVSNDFHNIFIVVVAGVIPAFAVFIIVWFAIDLMSSLFFGRGR